jgi:hypothetical protein
MFASIELSVQDLADFTFELGVTLNKYLESTADHQWTRKELSFGFLLFSIKLNWLFDLEPYQGEQDEEE